jgi:DNA-binding IclR family transcriptional regulator
MARLLELESTRVNRLLKTLAHLGLAQQTTDRQYVPGPAMHVLAAQAMFGSGLIRRAIEPLESLRELGLSVAMGVLWRDQVVYLYHGGQNVKPAQAIGRTGLFSATRSSIGMVLLARQPAAEIRAMYRLGEIPNFPEGVKSLQQELSRIRAAGFAITKPYDDQPITSMAVAIAHEPAAVALSGSIDRRRIENLKSALTDVATRIDAGPV